MMTGLDDRFLADAFTINVPAPGGFALVVIGLLSAVGFRRIQRRSYAVRPAS